MKRFGNINAGSTIVKCTVWVHFLAQSESLVVRPVVVVVIVSYFDTIL